MYEFMENFIYSQKQRRVQQTATTQPSLSFNDDQVCRSLHWFLKHSRVRHYLPLFNFRQEELLECNQANFFPHTSEENMTSDVFKMRKN